MIDLHRPPRMHLDSLSFTETQIRQVNAARQPLSHVINCHVCSFGMWGSDSPYAGLVQSCKFPLNSRYIDIGKSSTCTFKQVGQYYDGEGARGVHPWMGFGILLGIAPKAFWPFSLLPENLPGFVITRVWTQNHPLLSPVVFSYHRCGTGATAIVLEKESRKRFNILNWRFSLASLSLSQWFPPLDEHLH